MLFEIVTPYDSQDACDCHETLAELFVALAAMEDMNMPPATTQYEICVVAWDSWEEREIHLHDRDFEPPTVLDLDEMTHWRSA